ncbi:MAG TPA: CopG family antitoxin [bacterium]|nr:CopG family antitoxin [bacterium]HPN31218.1 CopG family antitoxin [bacterium]
MKKIIKKLPAFKTVEEESDFFDNHSLDEFETEDVTNEFYKELEKEKKKKITLWLDTDTINTLKSKAGQYGVAYQKFTRTLLKTSLERI